MIAIALVASALAAIPTGVEVDCSTWPSKFRVEMKITVISSGGKKLVSGNMLIGANASAGAVQDTIVAAMEDEPGWVVKAGKGDTVIIFAPKGETIKSIRFDCERWVPVYRKILVAERPKARK